MSTLTMLCRFKIELEVHGDGPPGAATRPTRPPSRPPRRIHFPTAPAHCLIATTDRPPTLDWQRPTSRARNSSTSVRRHPRQALHTPPQHDDGRRSPERGVHTQDGVGAGHLQGRRRAQGTAAALPLPARGPGLWRGPVPSRCSRQHDNHWARTRARAHSRGHHCTAAAAAPMPAAQQPHQPHHSLRSDGPCRAVHADPTRPRCARPRPPPYTPPPKPQRKRAPRTRR